MNKRSQGVALITVLLIVALAAIIATQMTARLQLQMQRTANVNFNQQAYWYAMGAEAFAKRVLLQTFKDDPSVGHLEQIWAQGETSFPVDYGQITGEIFDSQACFNLNALYIPTSTGGNPPSGDTPGGDTPGGGATSIFTPKEILKRLITKLDVEGVSEFEAESMVNALIDWLDENSSITSSTGAEDNDYASKEFPYLAANNMLASINELRVIEHFTVPLIDALKDYVCVLPNNNLHKININTLDSEKALLLAAIIDQGESEAESILSSRPEEGFTDMTDFFNMPELTDVQRDSEFDEMFVVVSEYFTLKATASFNNSFFALTSMMKVEDSGKEITVMSRSVGRF